MRWGLLLVGLALIGGCKLSKEESSLAHYDEMARNRKKADPPGFYKEAAVGVRYYPDADKASCRQYDEDGGHIVEIGLSTTDPIDKVRDFYEREIGAKAMPMVAKNYSIQSDANGKHYEVDYGQYGEDVSITIQLVRPTG